MDERSFVAYAERQAAIWRERYGVAEDGAWTDEQIERALADHDFPPLEQLPAEPRGMMAEQFGAEVKPGEGRAWQRVNALHLVAHAMLHVGERCGGCEDWGSATR